MINFLFVQLLVIVVESSVGDANFGGIDRHNRLFDDAVSEGL